MSTRRLRRCGPRRARSSILRAERSGRSAIATGYCRTEYAATSAEGGWCERGELNPHGLPHWILSPARLPGSATLARRDFDTLPQSPCRSAAPLSLPPRLKELDRVARRVVQQALRTARSGHDVATELNPGRAESIDLSREVFDDEVDAVPAPRTGPASIGHGAASRARRSAEQQPQVATGHVGKGRQCLGDEREPEAGRVEGDGRLDIVDHVTHVHSGHGSSFLGASPDTTLVIVAPHPIGRLRSSR